MLTHAFYTPTLATIAKMKTKTLIIFIATVLLASCSSEIDYSNLYGSWKPTTIAVNGMNISEEIIFNDKGEYKAISSFNDSLVYKVNGEFTVNKRNSSIEIKFTGIIKNNEKIESISDSTYSINIIELFESELILESENGMSKYTKKQ